MHRVCTREQTQTAVAICQILKCFLMIKCIIMLYYNAITPSATALLSTWLHSPPSAGCLGGQRLAPMSKWSHKPNWQISIGTHSHRAKVGFCVEWHLDIWSVCPLFSYWLSACKRDIWGRHMSPSTPGSWSFCFTLPAPPQPCGTRSCKKATHLIFSIAAGNERNVHLCAPQ